MLCFARRLAALTDAGKERSNKSIKKTAGIKFITITCLKNSAVVRMCVFWYTPLVKSTIQNIKRIEKYKTCFSYKYILFA